MQDFKLFMMLLGGKPAGRQTEQHDIFFFVGNELRDCVPEIIRFWPEAAKTLHIDAWRNVCFVDGYRVKIHERGENLSVTKAVQLFFVNLGGYKPGEFEEFHYKLIIAAANREEAIQRAKKVAFFRQQQSPHVDDKYGIDVDDIYNIEEILPASVKLRYHILLEPADENPEDEIHLGYFKLDKL